MIIESIAGPKKYHVTRPTSFYYFRSSSLNIIVGDRNFANKNQTVTSVLCEF